MLSLRFVVAALLVLGLSWRAHAWCDGDSFSRNAPGSTIASGPVALAGIVGGIGNAVSDGGDGRASLGWRVSGFVTGALGLAAGVTTLVYSTGGGDCTGGGGIRAWNRSGHREPRDCCGGFRPTAPAARPVPRGPAAGLARSVGGGWCEGDCFRWPRAATDFLLRGAARVGSSLDRAGPVASARGLTLCTAPARPKTGLSGGARRPGGAPPR